MKTLPFFGATFIASSQSEDPLRKARELSVGIGKKTSEYLENDAFLACGV